jgi:hypothetical protein
MRKIKCYMGAERLSKDSSKGHFLCVEGKRLSSKCFIKKRKMKKQFFE